MACITLVLYSANIAQKGPEKVDQELSTYWCFDLGTGLHRDGSFVLKSERLLRYLKWRQKEVEVPHSASLATDLCMCELAERIMDNLKPVLKLKIALWASNATHYNYFP